MNLLKIDPDSSFIKRNEKYKHIATAKLFSTIISYSTAKANEKFALKLIRLIDRVFLILL